jgi:type IV secretion system protein VirB11
MSADPHRVVYINEALKPLMRWLEDSQVVEISANGPGAVFVERFGQTYMERHELPALTESAIVHLAERVAAYTGQAVNIERPLLSAALPNGDRFQAVLAPATPTGGAFAIRKQVIQDMRLDRSTA